jgi:hypothetical protein
MKMKKLATIISLLVFTSLMAIFGYKYLVFPEPPEILFKSASVSRYYHTIPSGVEFKSCSIEELSSVQKLDNRLEPKNYKYYQEDKNCKKFQIDTEQSIFIFTADFDSQISRKVEGSYELIAQNRLGYPQRTLELKSVTKDGFIYIDYGGYEYFGNDDSGSAQWVIDLNLNK